MRLAAIYIKDHFLFEKPQVINFGGKYIYSFLEKENKNFVSRIENKSFIESFWGENISLVSAIVGENGVGKTSLLKEICYKNRQAKIIYLIENQLKTAYNESLSDPLKPWVELEFDNENISLISQIENNHFGYSINNTLNINAKLEFLIYNSIDFENQTDSKLETRIKQFKKVFLFLMNKELINIIKINHGLDINFFKEVCFKPSSFYYEDVFIEKELELYIDETKDYISKEEFINLLNSKKYKCFLYDLIVMYPYNYRALQQTMKILFLSKIYILKCISLSKKNRKDFINWLYDNSIIENISDNKYFINIIQQMLLFKERKQEFKLTLETTIYFESFFSKVFENLNFKVSYENENEISEIFKSFSGINHFFQIKKVTKNIDFLEEIILFEPAHNISQGEYFLIQLLSNLYSLRTEEIKFIMLDESDLGFHPYWKKKFVNILVDVLPRIFQNSKINPIQIILTTHDPFTLSDIPNSNIVYLKKENANTFVIDKIKEEKKSFGANITDLLADGFFIEDGLIGDFAKGKINKTLNWLRIKGNEFYAKKVFKIDEKIEYSKVEYSNEYNKKVIEIIDEPLVKNQLKQMYLDFIEDNEFIDIEIERLKNLKK